MGQNMGMYTKNRQERSKISSGLVCKQYKWKSNKGENGLEMYILEIRVQISQMHIETFWRSIQKTYFLYLWKMQFLFILSLSTDLTSVSTHLHVAECNVILVKKSHTKYLLIKFSCFFVLFVYFSYLKPHLETLIWKKISESAMCNLCLIVKCKHLLRLLKGQFTPKSKIHIFSLTCRAIYQSI